MMKDDIKCNQDMFFEAASSLVGQAYNDGKIKSGDWCSIVLLDNAERTMPGGDTTGILSVQTSQMAARRMRRSLQKKWEHSACYLGSVSFQLK